MKTLFFVLILSLSFVAEAQVRSLQISLGEEKVLPLSGGSSVWIQDGKILKAMATGRGLTIKGLKEGSTTLKAGDAVFEIQVFHPLQLSAHTVLSQDIRKIVGLKLETRDGQHIVKGRLYRMKDWREIRRLSEKHRAILAMEAEISESLRQDMQDHLSALLVRAKLPPQTLIFDPQLEVRVAGSELTLKKYRQLLNPLAIQIIQDKDSLEIAPTIRVQITVAEIKRDKLMKYGLRWPSSYSAQLLPTGLVERDLLPFNATALEAQGMGKILASPNIICRSGKEAEFLAGGEFPIKIMNYKMQDIVWKKYGILLKVKPLADSAGRMSISIETQISTLDDSRRVDDIPGLLTNHVSSHFDLSRPRTIALSGLLKNEGSKSHEGLPLLARLPILGALFSSKDFKENRSELVIFVRPSIMSETEQENQSPEHLHTLEL